MNISSYTSAFFESLLPAKKVYIMAKCIDKLWLLNKPM